MASCSGTDNDNGSATTETEDTTQFFQISGFIRQQIEEVKKTPFYIYKKTETDGRVDSVSSDNEGFLKLAENFLHPDIAKMPFKKNYTENIFFDETTKTISITYTTTDKSMEVQNANIIMDEDGKTVKRIFIRKFFNYSDSSAIEQLGWKPNESFQINRFVQASDQKDKTTLTSVVWNEKK